MCDVLTRSQRKSVDDFIVYASKVLSDTNGFDRVMREAGFLTNDGYVDWQRKCDDHVPFRSSDVFNAE